MRICLVTREYPSLGSHGGIGTYTSNLVQGLSARGHDVTVIAHAEPGVRAFNEGNGRGVRVEPVAAADKWRLPAGNGFVGMTMKALPFTYAAARKFIELDRIAPFDVVEIPEYQGWGLGVALAARCPVIVRLHTHTALVRRLNDVPINFDAKAVGAMERASIVRGARVLANSEALAEVARRDFRLAPEKVEVLPLGIDTDCFAPQDPTWLRAKLAVPDDAPLVLYVGRLERRKGVETLIESFAHVLKRHPRAVLALAGFSTDTGPNQQGLLDVLRARVQAMGASEQVHFLGHVPYELLPRYYSGCDLFLAPSIYEPFGMIYLEAMACGKVAVGCDTGGVPEIIRHAQTGYLVPPSAPEALGSAMTELLQYPSWRNRIGQAAREAVLQQFSLPVIAERTEAYYAEAIAEQSTRNRRPRVVLEEERPYARLS